MESDNKEDIAQSILLMVYAGAMCIYMRNEVKNIEIIKYLQFLNMGLRLYFYSLLMGGEKHPQMKELEDLFNN